MERQSPAFSYLNRVEKDTDLIKGTIVMEWERKTWEISYYLISDEVYAHDEEAFADRPEVNQTLGMLSYFYNESDQLLDTIALFPPIPDELIQSKLSHDWVEEWQRYFFLSGVKDMGYIVDQTQSLNERMAQALIDIGFEEVLSSEEEKKSFFFFTTSYTPPVDYPDDENGAVLQQLKDGGVDMSQPHEVEFVLICPNKRTARKGLKTLELEGYEVELHEEEEEILLLCKMKMELTHSGIVNRQRELEELVKAYDMALDGWGVMID